jgi:hypothetical protein
MVGTRVLRAPRDAPSHVARAEISLDNSSDTPSPYLLPHAAVEPEQHFSPYLAMAPRDILPPTFDRDLWERRLEVPTEGGLSLSKITDRLGLKRKRGTRGRISFQSEKARRLSAAVAVLASKLPKDAARLIDRALDTGDTKNQLLQRFGEIIWGPEKSRPWLYEPSDGIDGYTHALRYSNQDDRAM